MPRKLVAFAALVAVLALPAASHAAETFGSRLTNMPANGSDLCADPAPGPCTLVGHINPNAAGDPVTSPAPSSGVIVRFRLRTIAAEPVTLRLATLMDQGGTLLAQAAGTGPTVTTQGSGAIEEFPARLAVQSGEHLALNAGSSHMVYNQGGDQFTPVYAPPLADGQGPRGPIGDPTCELLLQAVMEADADGDGFGDETQDACPRQAANQGACDDAGPRISRVSVKRRRIRYRLSEEADVTFRLQRARPGRRARGKCRRPSARNVRRPRCTRFVTMRGAFTDAGEAGANRRALPRRLRGRRVRPGRYRLVISAVDEFGNETRVRKRFRIRR
jgi:hypothetical protein